MHGFRSFDNPDDFKLEKLENGDYRVTTRISWSDVSHVVLGLRLEGMTHDESTAWLESHVPTFREGMVLITITEGNKAFPVGSQLWIERPNTVTVTGRIVDAT